MKIWTNPHWSYCMRLQLRNTNGISAFDNGISLFCNRNYMQMRVLITGLSIHWTRVYVAQQQDWTGQSGHTSTNIKRCRLNRYILFLFSAQDEGQIECNENRDRGSRLEILTRDTDAIFCRCDSIILGKGERTEQERDQKHKSSGGHVSQRQQRTRTRDQDQPHEPASKRRMGRCVPTHTSHAYALSEAIACEHTHIHMCGVCTELSILANTLKMRVLFLYVRHINKSRCAHTHIERAPTNNLWKLACVLVGISEVSTLLALDDLCIDVCELVVSGWVSMYACSTDLCERSQYNSRTFECVYTFVGVCAFVRLRECNVMFISIHYKCMKNTVI